MNKYQLCEVLSELKDLYKRESLIPFIGAGFSIPLELPDWSDLIGRLGESLGYEKELFLELGSFSQLAEFACKYKKREWNEFLLKVTSGFNSTDSEQKRKESIQHKALGELNFKTIYTTNYDLHIEGAIKDARKKPFSISTYEDFLSSRNTNYDCEVLKFHGTLQEQDSIILTESQYFERMELEDAIDQKLRADVLRNSFLFIGYSFSDPNIRYIFYKLHKLREQISKAQEESYSYITTFGMNEIQAKLLKQWNIKVIELDPKNREQSITDLLNSLKA